MSARRAARPDLALAPIREAWVPQPGDRVHRDDHRTLAQITHGTASVLYVSRDGMRVAVSLDDTSGAYGMTDWPLHRTRPASTPAKERP